MGVPRTESLRDWVQSIAEVTKPERVVFCDGSDAEARAIEAEMVADGSFIPLHPEKLPRSFLHRSHPSDVARTEQVTFICSQSADDAGPTNNWMSPSDARARVWPLFRSAMAQRTMYVVPYLMGPIGSRYSRVGVEITDSPYVVANLRLMTRMGDVALRHLDDSPEFVKGIHSLGDLDPARRFICHFPEDRMIWSIGSGYGGNALLAKKCHALRLASVEARDEGWLAEHMLIVGITDPRGRTTYLAAAFPSGCGKTNLAMIIPTLPGYTVETIGDDIAWMHVGHDGRLWAVNPEAGMFGIAVGTNTQTNANAMAAVSHDTIFTNVGLGADKTVWWDGMNQPRPDGLLDWQGRLAGAHESIAHPNARYTVRASQCPSVGQGIHDPEGVPISGIIFGGRRQKLTPLVFESLSFAHGVYVGATMVSETTAAATGATGVTRHDPMAMRPFCGYNMADYFQHWLDVGKRLDFPPRVFSVNWFRSDDDGRLLWPGYGENIRVLQWMIDRIHGEGAAHLSAVGYVPAEGGLNLSGLGKSHAKYDELFAIDHQAWAREADEHLEFLAQFGGRIPDALLREQAALAARVEAARLEEERPWAVASLSASGGAVGRRETGQKAR